MISITKRSEIELKRFEIILSPSDYQEEPEENNGRDVNLYCTRCKNILNVIQFTYKSSSVNT